MANSVPLYTASREHARAHDEIPLWRESINENIRCKQAIENAIRQKERAAARFPCPQPAG